MKVADIKVRARKMGIQPGKMNKRDLIRAIQAAENNIVCFATERVDSCEEHACLWRPDCLVATGRAR